MAARIPRITPLTISGSRRSNRRGGDLAIVPRIRALVFAASLLGCLGAKSLAQVAVPPAPVQPAPPANAAEAAPSRAITVDVTVTDKSGRPIGALERGDFTLFDNNQPAEVVDFRAADSTPSAADPVRVLVLIDTINNSIDTVAREREQLDEFLRQKDGELSYPTSIGFLADSGLVLPAASTQDGKALLANLRSSQSELRTIGRAAGFWGATERLQQSLNQFDQLIQQESTQPGRKLVLIIGSGWPMFAETSMYADTRQRTWIFNAIVHLTNRLREANITLYCLDPFNLGRTNPFFYEGYRKAVTKIDQAQYPNLSLQVLAEHSGGLVIVNGNDIREEINTAVRDASSYYEIRFAAAHSADKTQYHALKIEVDKPGLVVRTTAGYYTLPGS
jgi:VWFA-related protein